MERRDVLKGGVAIGGALGLASEGCAATPAAPRVPSASELRALDVEGFLGRLDASREKLRTSATLESVLPRDTPRRVAEDPRYAHAEQLMRKTLRSLVLVGSFGDLPEEARVHPGVQDRMWRSMPEMNEAVLGMNAELVSFSPTERADVSRALRDDPALGDRILDALDREAVKAGITDKRRAHLRSIGQIATFRLKQSTSLFIDEYDDKVQKVSARSGAIEEVQRRLATRMGEQAFWDFHARQVALAKAWQAAGAQPGAPPAPQPPAPGAGPPGPPPPVGMTPEPPPPPPPGYIPVAQAPAEEEEKPKRGGTLLVVGGIMLGVGAILGVTGGILVATPNDEIGGAFVLTAAALLGIAGIVCLIVGAVLRANS